MKKDRVYTKHQAFDTTYEIIKSKPQIDLSGYEAAAQYHHDPDKLKQAEFKHYSAYFKWSIELYNASSRLSSKLRVIYDLSTHASSSFYLLNTEKRVNDIFVQLNQYQLDLGELREDIREFQMCILATDIAEKQTQIQILSDQLIYLSSLEDSIVNICNRKLYEISSSRMSFYSLFISSMALFVALISIYR